MDARCPACSFQFEAQRAGLQRCPGCGREVLITEPHGQAHAQGQAQGGQGPGAPPPPGSPLLLGREPTPWERRDELGIFRAFWEQWRDSMFYVDGFWRKVRPEGPPQDALFYGWAVQLLGFVLQAPFVLLSLGLFSGLMREAAGRQGGPGALPPDAQDLFGLASGPVGWLLLLLLGFAGTVLLYPVVLIVTSAILHLLCLLFGCGRHGFWATFRIVGYASSPQVAWGIPYLNVVSGLYVLVLWIWGITRVQETTGGRAAAAVLAPVGLLFCCCFTLFAFGFAAFFASLR